MKILGIVGSPRKGGNTDALIDRVLEGAKSRNAEVEKLYLRDLDISPCQGAFSCEATKSCPIPDDMKLVYPKLREATGFVIGGPVYVSAWSGLLEFMERWRPFASVIDPVRDSLSDADQEALSRERACLEIWEKGKSYDEAIISAEEVMTAIFRQLKDDTSKGHTEAYSSDAWLHKRLGTGKRLVFILSCWGVYGVGARYQAILDSVKFFLGNVIGLSIIDTILASGVLTRGDAEKRRDLMDRAFNAGQLLCQG